MIAYFEAVGIAKMRRTERPETVDRMPMETTRKIIKDELKMPLGWAGVKGRSRP